LERTTVVISHLGEIRVHEANTDSILVKQGGGEGNTLKDHPKILDSRTLFLESHGTAVVNIEDDVVESKLHNIVGNPKTLDQQRILDRGENAYSFATRQR
jgi:hypothetical protein